jgi:hypothetical protein
LGEVVVVGRVKLPVVVVVVVVWEPLRVVGVVWDRLVVVVVVWELEVVEVVVERGCTRVRLLVHAFRESKPKKKNVSRTHVRLFVRVFGVERVIGKKKHT